MVFNGFKKTKDKAQYEMKTGFGDNKIVNRILTLF